MMNSLIRNIITLAAFLSLSVSTASATIVSAQSSANILNTTESAQISLFLDLEIGETASVLEGVFRLSGHGSIANTILTAGGPSWSNSFGNIVNDEILLSLTSNNIGGPSRQIAILDIQALSPGTYELIYDDLSFASFDTNVSPFFQDLPLTNVDGEVLARITVVPIPAAMILYMSALSGLAVLRRRYILGLVRVKSHEHGTVAAEISEVPS